MLSVPDLTAASSILLRTRTARIMDISNNCCDALAAVGGVSPPGACDYNEEGMPDVGDALLPEGL